MKILKMEVIKLETVLFCDYCSYDIQMILEQFPNVENMNISRKNNEVTIYFEDYKNFNNDLVSAFSKEGYEISKIYGV